MALDENANKLILPDVEHKLVPVGHELLQDPVIKDNQGKMINLEAELPHLKPVAYGDEDNQLRAFVVPTINDGEFSFMGRLSSIFVGDLGAWVVDMSKIGGSNLSAKDIQDNPEAIKAAFNAQIEVINNLAAHPDLVTTKMQETGIPSKEKMAKYLQKINGGYFITVLPMGTSTEFGGSDLITNSIKHALSEENLKNTPPALA